MTARTRRILSQALPLALLLAAVTALLLAPSVSARADDELTVTVDIPDTDDELRVTDAQLRWGLNAETGSGAFFGGCNFLSAGVAGDAGSARVWSEVDAIGPDALFRTSDGNVRIEKPTSDGGWQPLTWGGRCTDAAGRTVTASGGDAGTGVTAVIDGGEGVVDVAAGTARIQWRGSVSVVFYGGMTYWWLSDPVLTVEPDGSGTLTATLGGYGASMEDLTKWDRLSSTSDVVIATLEDVRLGEDGLATVPVYQGVAVSTPADITAQRRDVDGWGSFPQGFVDFQVRTGQSAYWFTSGGLRDFAKPTTTLWISYDAANPQPAVPPPPSAPAVPDNTGSGTGTGTGTGVGTGSGAGAGSGGGAGGGSAVLAGATASPDGDEGPLASAPEWLSPGLIPVAVAEADERDVLAFGSAALLGLSSLAIVGFRSGFLVLPFSGNTL